VDHRAAVHLAVRLGHGDLPGGAAERAGESLYEAAELDGASRAQQFWRITVPLITPVIFFNMIMQMVHAFQEFNGPYAITEGGPLHSHLRAGLYIYDQSFRFFNLGYGAALSWVLFVLVAGLSALSFWSSRYWVFYAGEKDARPMNRRQMPSWPRLPRYLGWQWWRCSCSTRCCGWWAPRSRAMPRSSPRWASGPRRLDFGAYAKGWKTSTEYTFATYFLNSFPSACRASWSPWSVACWWPMPSRASSSGAEAAVRRDGGHHDAAARSCCGCRST
jgi:ABC-type Fe3+ transport system permease subunit